jgi:uncharacterized protein YndB with AHSA1/START domain
MMDAFDPELDLLLERVVDVPVEAVWTAWTTPEHLVKWFTPAPWKTVACDIDLRPGGVFRTVMKGPEGEEVDSAGCYLEVVENERLVFTDALGPGYRPKGEPFMTAIVTMTPEGSGTRYRAVAKHRDAKTRQTHEEMGFHEGWGTALDQLVEVAKTL